jgi:hypothetical protein
MARIATTSQKKNHTMPGIAYPATDLALATGPSYPGQFNLFQDMTEAGRAVGKSVPATAAEAAPR